MKFVTSHVIDRIDAEMGHLKIFSCFDVETIREAFACRDAKGGKKKQRGLLRKIHQIATDVGEDAEYAVFEYKRVAPVVVDLTSTGRPLATASNCEVWEEFLEEGKVTISDLPQSQSLRSLNELIRFYLAIEDGECQVERDLGVLSKFGAAHKNGSNELDDDLMLVQSDSTVCDDIWVAGRALATRGRPLATTGSQVSSYSCLLGSKGRRWAELWRQIYGARLGIYKKRSAVGDKGAKKPGTYAAAKFGVLAAAEYAVEISKQQKSQESGSQLTPLGVSESFLESAVGDRASLYDNVRLQKFKELSTKKRVRSQPFMRRNEELKKMRKDIRAAKAPLDITSISAIAFVGERGEKLPFPIFSEDLPEVQEKCGPDRSLKAGLVVVDDLGRLFDCPDDSSVNQVFAIVARGVPVITLSSWRLARGQIKAIPRASVTRHVSLAVTTKFIFEYDSVFQSRYQLLLNTMKECLKLPGCKWKVRPLAKNSAVREQQATYTEKGFVFFKLSGIECMRSWIQSHRRIVNTVGSKYVFFS